IRPPRTRMASAIRTWIASSGSVSCTERSDVLFVLDLRRTVGPIGIGFTLLSCSLLAPSRDELSGGRLGAIQSGGMSGSAGGVVAVEDSGNSGGGGANAEDGGPADVADEEQASMDASVDSPPLPHNVLACDTLGPVGEWKQITPAGVDLSCTGVACQNT